MANVTIRNLDDDVKTRLRVCAAEHHRSMEEEVRIILHDAVNGRQTGPRDLAKFTRECFAPLGSVELESPRVARCASRRTSPERSAMFVIDTNVASELVRPEPTPAVATWFSERDAREMYLTAVSEAEPRYGVAIMSAGRRRDALEAAMTRWLDQGFRARIRAVRQRCGPSLRGDRGRAPQNGPDDRRGRLPDRDHMPFQWRHLGHP